jgi:hemolysin III
MCAAFSAEEPLRRPLLRGYLHLVASGVAVAGLVGLLLIADTPRAVVGGVIFATSLILLYFTSGAYHTINWGVRMRGVLQRLDHSMIFVLIAGTYTPFCLLLANDAWGFSLLAVVWSIAAAGIVLKVAWPGAPRLLGVGLYMAAGWLGVIAGVPISEWLALTAIILLVLGGIVYTMGGLVYALRRPDPFPRIFGYHEVFHAFVIAGSVLHYTLIAAYLMPA